LTCYTNPTAGGAVDAKTAAAKCPEECKKKTAKPGDKCLATGTACANQCQWTWNPSANSNAGEWEAAATVCTTGPKTPTIDKQTCEAAGGLTCYTNPTDGGAVDADTAAAGCPADCKTKPTKADHKCLVTGAACPNQCQWTWNPNANSKAGAWEAATTVCTTSPKTPTIDKETCAAAGGLTCYTPPTPSGAADATAAAGNCPEECKKKTIPTDTTATATAAAWTTAWFSAFCLIF